MKKSKVLERLFFLTCLQHFHVDHHLAFMLLEFESYGDSA